MLLLQEPIEICCNDKSTSSRRAQMEKIILKRRGTRTASPENKYSFYLSSSLCQLRFFGLFPDCQPVQSHMSADALEVVFVDLFHNSLQSRFSPLLNLKQSKPQSFVFLLQCIDSSSHDVGPSAVSGLCKLASAHVPAQQLPNTIYFSLSQNTMQNYVIM